MQNPTGNGSGKTPNEWKLSSMDESGIESDEDAPKEGGHLRVDQTILRDQTDRLPELL